LISLTVGNSVFNDSTTSGLNNVAQTLASEVNTVVTSAGMMQAGSVYHLVNIPSTVNARGYAVNLSSDKFSYILIVYIPGNPQIKAVVRLNFGFNSSSISGIALCQPVKNSLCPQGLLPPPKSVSPTSGFFSGSRNIVIWATTNGVIITAGFGELQN